MQSIDITLYGWVPSSKNTHRVGKRRLWSSSEYATWKKEAILAIRRLLDDNNEPDVVFPAGMNVSLSIWYRYPERRIRKHGKNTKTPGAPIRKKDGTWSTTPVSFDSIGIIESIADALQDSGILENDRSIHTVHCYALKDTTRTIPEVIIQVTEGHGIIGQNPNESGVPSHSTYPDLGESVAMPSVMSIKEWHHERRAQEGHTDDTGDEMPKPIPPHKAQCALCEILIGERRVEQEIIGVWSDRFSERFTPLLDSDELPIDVRQICGSCARDLIATTRREHNNRITRHNNAVHAACTAENATEPDRNHPSIISEWGWTEIPTKERKHVPTVQEKELLSPHYFPEICAIQLVSEEEIMVIPWSVIFQRRRMVAEAIGHALKDSGDDDDTRQTIVQQVLRTIIFHPYTKEDVVDTRKRTIRIRRSEESHDDEHNGRDERQQQRRRITIKRRSKHST